MGLTIENLVAALERSGADYDSVIAYDDGTLMPHFDDWTFDDDSFLLCDDESPGDYDEVGEGEDGVMTVGLLIAAYEEMDEDERGAVLRRSLRGGGSGRGSCEYVIRIVSLRMDGGGGGLVRLTWDNDD